VHPCADIGESCEPGMVAMRGIFDLPADIARGNAHGQPRSIEARRSMLRSSKRWTVAFPGVDERKEEMIDPKIGRH
jgi:hypothetical protein